MKIGAIKLLTIATLLPAGAIAAEAVKIIPPQQKVLSSENGRYVFGQISDFRSDQYMLDTKTGRLWMIVLRKPKNPDGTDASGEGFRVLDSVPYVNVDGSLALEPK